MLGSSHCDRAAVSSRPCDAQPAGFAVYTLVANGNWRSPALARRVAGKDRTGQGLNFSALEQAFNATLKGAGSPNRQCARVVRDGRPALIYGQL
jgi:hypothetical protein